MYTHYLEEINADPIDLLENPIDNEENEMDDKEDEELFDNDEQEELWSDWMHLVEMDPNAVISHSFDLGSRDIDQNHDWINDIRQRYFDTDLIEAGTFVNRVSSSGQRNAEKEGNDDLIMDYEMLNEK